MKSTIAQGQMFVCHSFPFPHSNTKNETQVWVKVREDNEHSVFVDNSAMARVAVKAQSRLRCTEVWHLSDEYYERGVAEGRFVPIDDLRDTDKVCDEKGWPRYEIDLGF